MLYRLSSWEVVLFIKSAVLSVCVQGPTDALIAEGWLVPDGEAEGQWKTTVCCGYFVVHQRASLYRRVGLKGPLYGHACLNRTPARVH